MLTVVTSYHNRPENYRKFVEVAHEVPSDLDIHFIIQEWDKPKELFSTGELHNRAVEKAPTGWILKQDIDCIAEDGFYDNLIHHLENKPITYFMNIGVYNYKYQDASLRFPQGNQWVVHKSLYEKVGGEPEWGGYGWEDYALLYKLKKAVDPSYKLQYTEENVSCVIRDQLARPMNLKSADMYLWHNEHEYSSTLNVEARENLKRLYKLCKEIDGD